MSNPTNLSKREIEACFMRWVIKDYYEGDVLMAPVLKRAIAKKKAVAKKKAAPKKKVDVKKLKTEEPRVLENKRENSEVLKMAKRLKECGSSYCADSFIMRKDDGTVVSSELLAGACYAFVPYLHPNVPGDPSGWGNGIKGAEYKVIAFVDNSMRLHKKVSAGLVPKDWDDLDIMQKEYINWCINDSPFAKAFLVKDAKWVFNNSAIMDVNLPSGFVLSACMQLRYVKEFPNRIPFWYYMKDVMPPELALYFSQLGYIDIQNKKLKQWYIPSGVMNYGHSIFTHQFGREGLINYLQHNPINLEALEPLTKTCSIIHFHRVWTNGDGIGPVVKIPQTGKLEEIGNNWGGVKKNLVFDFSEPNKFLSQFIKLNGLEDVINVEENRVYHK